MASVPSSATVLVSYLQAQVNDIVRIMRETIKEVSERGENLDSLQGKTDDLAVHSNGFRRDANKVNKRTCSKHVKSRMYLISCVIFLLVVLLIIPVVTLALNRHS
ncbi:synaptobrevin [Mollisia scopiformis]|uniref:Synaptobrevin n=1 Tax=Mollisia scopiformis TaxID=149040 RepID=A0A132BAR9_MOLSC|nr:synaptobrevin [Mollisia scopiformis]KUJ09510.1 synaptobrevin [Mollisia scopiformis]